MNKKKQSKYVFYVIKGSTIKKFILLDLVTGTGIYYVLKILYSSMLIASVGSMVGTEGIKKYKKIKTLIGNKKSSGAFRGFPSSQGR